MLLHSKHWMIGIGLALILTPIHGYGQVPVTVGPEPKTQFLNNAGAPLAGGIVCTYQSGTSTPLATYQDSLGTVVNTNPIVLDASGRANIWWQSAAYKVVLAGGGTCASPSNLQWTVDGFQVGVFLNGNNTWTGNNTFSGNVVVNGTFTANSGGSLNGTFSGNPNFSGSPTFTGVLVASQFQSTIATGTTPLIIASTTLVPNLNVGTVSGCVISGTPSASQVIEASSSTTCSWQSVVSNEATLSSGLTGATSMGGGAFGPKQVLNIAHTITRMYGFEQGQFMSCSTAPVVALWDFTSSTPLTTITIPNSTTNIDSGPLSIAMTAGHIFGFNITTGEIGCGSGIVTITITYQ